MIASFLLYYCLLLLILLNSKERLNRNKRARWTTLGMTERVECANCCSQTRRRESTGANLNVDKLHERDQKMLVSIYVVSARSIVGSRRTVKGRRPAKVGLGLGLFPISVSEFDTSFPFIHDITVFAWRQLRC